MAQKIFNKKNNRQVELSSVEEIRIASLSSCSYQGLYNMRTLIEDESYIESKAEKLLKEKNYSFDYILVIEKTDLPMKNSTYGTTIDRFVLPIEARTDLNESVKMKLKDCDFFIKSLKFGEPFEIFYLKKGEYNEEADPFFIHTPAVISKRCRAFWTTTNVVHMTVNEWDESIIVYTEDCQRYKISFKPKKFFNIFEE